MKNFIWTAAVLVPTCWAFMITPKGRATSQSFGIAEWRDLMFDFAGTGDDDQRMGMEQAVEQAVPPKSICILPFPYQDVLLMGETKQLRLYEDRFMQLFEDVMDNHEGVMAMGLLSQSGIIQTVPIVEVEAYNRMENLGIFCTIRVVARAQLVELTQQEPYIKAVCTEITDSLPPNLAMPNLLADTIEECMVTLSALEYKLDHLNTIPDSKKDKDRETRKTLGKLEDRFYDDDENGDENLDTPPPDCRRRYQQAYRIVMETDTQGYVSSNSDESIRSAKDLAAVSWAAFMTGSAPDEDATYRIQAIDERDVFERLKLASVLLKQQKDGLQKKVLKAKKDDGDELDV